jgi:hypothetical protein
METTLRRRRKMEDGRIETFTPMRNADGYYILADRVVDPQHNKAINQFYVKDLNAVVSRIRAGGVSLRMKGDITGQPNLISAAEIEIIRSDDDDPFASFSEWSGADDDASYRDL